MRNSIAVIYLARGLPGGLQPVQEFFSSYKAHTPGLAHSLRVLVKGWDAVPGLDTVVDMAKALGADVIRVEDDGFDFGAYFRIVPRINENWICFLNTNSRIRFDNWLAFLFQGVQGPQVGAAGATGSWESQARNACLALRADSVPMAVRGIARVAYHGLHFPGFPNPHLRSNAILTRTALFGQFAQGRAIPRSKREAHRLESGRFGFAAFLRRRRLNQVVCGADGKVYLPADWPISATFRSLDQRNLLVADYQTSRYETQPSAVRQALQLAAWGRFINDSVVADTK
jgi:hypothetical protein